MGRRKNRGTFLTLRTAAALALLVVFVIALHDTRSAPAHSISARTAVFGIDQYRNHLSPHLRGVIQCRFTPTCSAYGREVMRKYGFARGTWMTAKRIGRCGPWTKMGTVDLP